MNNASSNNSNPHINIPKKIIEKIESMNNELETLFANADKNITPFKCKISFRITNSAPQDILTDEERSAFLNFVLKVKDTPNYDTPQIDTDGKKFLLGNVDLARHVINEMRPIIFNRTDATFYTKIHNTLAKMFVRENHGMGTKITVSKLENGVESDVTKEYLTFMSQSRDAIKSILAQLDFDYLYNGILQHSDSRFFKRYEEDSHNGELNYILMKHAFVITRLKGYLRPYDLCAGIFWYNGRPIPGGLA